MAGLSASRLTAGLAGVALLCTVACRQPAPARQYTVVGQVLAVHPDRQEITIKHEDIAGFMPGMTMSFGAATPALLEGRVPGDLVTATLEVGETTSRLTAIAKTGTAALPDRTNEVALAEGLLDAGDLVPDAAFIDQRDQRRSFAEWRGWPTLVTFIYTSCPVPNFCPLMDQNFATIQSAVAEDGALAGKVKLISISFDPETDTPAVLAAHAAKRHADPAVWTFLTGDRVTVDRFAARFGVGLVRPETTTEIMHNLRTALIGRDGRIVKMYSGADWTPHAVLADLRSAVLAPAP